MANNSSRIDITLTGTNKASGAMKSAEKDIKSVQDAANKKTTMNIDAKNANAQTKELSKNLNSTSIAAERAKGSTTAAAGGTKQLGSGAQSASVGLKGMNMNLAFAGQSLQQITSMFMGAATASSIFTDAINAAMLKEQGLVQLQSKFGEGAEGMQKQMESIAAITPGDDTVLKQLLTKGAMDGNLTSMSEMNSLAQAFAGYSAGSLASGKTMAEVYRDLKDYIFTGNTGVLELDSIYREHIGQLKEAKTVTERIAVINQLNKEHYNDILANSSTLTNVWEVIKGNMEMASAELGSALLPTIKALALAFLDLNKGTGGWATKGVIIAGLMVGLVVSVVTLIGALEFLGISFATAGNAASLTGVRFLGFGLQSEGAVAALIGLNGALWSNVTGFFANIAALNGSTASTVANTVATWAQETAYIIRNAGLQAYLGISIAGTAATLKDTIASGASAAASLIAGAAKLTWAAATGVLTVALAVLEAVGAPILILIAALAAIVYVASSSFRDGAATMAAYNNELENGDSKVSKLRESSAYYAKQVDELTAKKQEMAAAGQDTAAIEAQIADAQSKSASTAEQAAIGEKALQDARAKKDEQTQRAAANEAEYSEQLKETLRTLGAKPEDVAAVDTGALDAGTRQREYGIKQQERLLAEGKKFTDSVVDGSNEQADAWKRDTEALSEYGTGMDKLGQLEIDYNNAEGWGEKLGILWDQFVTKAQVDWINAMIVLGDWWNWFTGPIVGAIDWLNGAWGNMTKYLQDSWINAENIIHGSIDGFGQWIQGLKDRVIQLWDEMVQYLKDKWNEMTDAVKQAWDNLKAWIENGIQTVLNIGYGIIAWVRKKWDELKGWIQKGISTALSIGTGAIDLARQKYNDLKNWIMSNPIVQKIVTVTQSGAAAVTNVVETVKSGASWLWGKLTGKSTGPGSHMTSARGPGEDPASDGIRTSYQAYPGYTGKNAWSNDGSCLTGNCVDMSVALVQKYGGSLVNGMWGNSLHTWWKSPTGQEYDPSRKAINNTWAPPGSSGPSSTENGVTFVFEKEVYGFDDFAAQVEKVTGQNIRRVI